jgi:Protein of unknown function (DUF3179)
VWTRTVNGRVLHFYLAGINNQNFLMRDRETGTWWQQITGKALYGPLQGAALQLVLSDELTFGEWKSEVSDGKVLAEVKKDTKEYDGDWEPKVAKLPVVISFPGSELKPRDVVVGLELDGASRAYPWDTVVKQSPVVDHMQGVPLLIAVGPDGKSFRVFKSRIDGKDAEFFLKGENEVETKEAATKGGPATPKSWALLDTATASEWNFQGCAISGPSQSKCLDRIPALKDYWFDWRNYHPNTTIYKR